MKYLAAVCLLCLAQSSTAQDSRTTETLRSLEAEVVAMKSDMFTPYFQSSLGPEREGYGRSVEQLETMATMLRSLVIYSELCDGSSCEGERGMACQLLASGASQMAEEIADQMESWSDYYTNNRAFGNATDAFEGTDRLGQRVYGSLSSLGGQ